MLTSEMLMLRSRTPSFPLLFVRGQSEPEHAHTFLDYHWGLAETPPVLIHASCCGCYSWHDSDELNYSLQEVGAVVALLRCVCVSINVHACKTRLRFRCRSCTALLERQNKVSMLQGQKFPLCQHRNGFSGQQHGARERLKTDSEK